MAAFSEFIGKKKIGQILIEIGAIDEEKLEWALKQQEEQQEKTEDPERLGQILLKAGYINEEAITIALAKQYDASFVDLDDLTVNEDAKKAVPANLLTLGLFIPIEVSNQLLTIAISDPTNYEIIDRIGIVTGFEIKYVLATPRQIRKYLGIEEPKEGEKGPSAEDEMREAGSAEEVLDDINLEYGEGEDGGNKKADILRQQADQKPIILLVNKIVISALSERTSDIHIESQESRMLVRFRIDGCLHERMTVAKKAADAVISRIKVMADLNIAERMIPQDGAFSLKIGEKTVDFRISIIPCAEGECACLRILAKENLKLDLQALGFNDSDYAKFRRAIIRPYGMILVSGPTGSGKTTTLYASLQSLNDSETKIITAEDPVEYRIHGLNQIECKINKNDPDRSLTFGKALKAMLRHDPDIILLGEIRDNETADIGVKAALTGHLVFSTVHANNAIDVIGRMADLGVDRYLLASAFIMVIAQRLVRTICPKCRIDHQPDAQQLKDGDMTAPEFADFKFYTGKGCDNCKGTGMRGRAAIYEILVIDDEIRSMVADGTSLYEIKKVGLAKGMSTLRSSTIEKMRKGETNIDELIRILAG